MQSDTTGGVQSGARLQVSGPALKVERMKLHSPRRLLRCNSEKQNIRGHRPPPQRHDRYVLGTGRWMKHPTGWEAHLLEAEPVACSSCLRRWLRRRRCGISASATSHSCKKACAPRQASRGSNCELATARPIVSKSNTWHNARRTKVNIRDCPSIAPYRAYPTRTSLTLALPPSESAEGRATRRRGRRSIAASGGTARGLCGRRRRLRATQPKLVGRL